MILTSKDMFCDAKEEEYKPTLGAATKSNHGSKV